MNFKTLTTYLIADSLDEDKHNITSRIIEEAGITSSRETYQWVRHNNWQGGESVEDIVRMWHETFQPISQLDEANQLVRIAHELADMCDLEEIEIDGEWIDLWQIKSFFGSYLAEYGLDYE